MKKEIKNRLSLIKSLKESNYSDDDIIRLLMNKTVDSSLLEELDTRYKEVKRTNIPLSRVLKNNIKKN